MFQWSTIQHRKLRCATKGHSAFMQFLVLLVAFQESLVKNVEVCHPVGIHVFGSSCVGMPGKYIMIAACHFLGLSISWSLKGERDTILTILIQKKETRWQSTTHLRHLELSWKQLLVIFSPVVKSFKPWRWALNRRFGLLAAWRPFVHQIHQNHDFFAHPSSMLGLLHYFLGRFCCALDSRY